MERTPKTSRPGQHARRTEAPHRDRNGVETSLLRQPGLAPDWVNLPPHPTAQRLRQGAVAGVQRAAGNRSLALLAAGGAIQRDHHTPEARRERAARGGGEVEGEAEGAPGGEGTTPLVITASSLPDAARQMVRYLRPGAAVMMMVIHGRSMRLFDELGRALAGRRFRLQHQTTLPPGVYGTPGRGDPSLHRLLIGPGGTLVVSDRAEVTGATPEQMEASQARGAGPGSVFVNLAETADEEEMTSLGTGRTSIVVVPSVPPRPRGPFGEEGAAELGIGGESEGEPRERRGRVGPPERPAWPASIRGEELQAPGGIGTFSMMLDYRSAGSDLLSQASAASNLVLYRWRVWDVTRRARERGVTTTEGAGALVEGGEAGAGQEVEQGAAAGARRGHVVREQGEDIEHGAEDLGPAIVILGPLAVLTAASSALVAAGGELVDTFADSMGGFNEEREIPWPEREGAYLVQCVAYPRPQGEHGEIRYLPSRARKLVYVRNPRRLAQAELIRPEREVEELQERLQAESNAEERARLQEELQTAQVNAQGSAIDVIRNGLERVRRQLAALPSWDIYRRRDLEWERDRLQSQLERAIERTEGGTNVTRPRGVLVSRVSGQRYPLLLQLMDLGRQGETYRYRLSDMTDRSGGVYEGEGATRDAAVEDAIREMANECGYGRGLLVIRIARSGGSPGSHPSPGDRRVESAPRNLALARAKLNDLVTVLTALGMLVPGVGEVAAVAGALLAAERMVNRYRLGTLELDAESVTDTVSILGGVAQVGQTVGQLRLARHGRRFTLSLERGDAAAAMAAARGGERARGLVRGAEVAGRAIDRIDIVTGNLQTLNDILEVNEAERTGQITHTEARRRRSHIAAQAIHSNAMSIHGALREAGAPEGDGEAGAGPSRPEDVGPVRRPPEGEEAPEGRAPNEAPLSRGPNVPATPRGPEPEGGAEAAEGGPPRPAEGEEEGVTRARTSETPSASPAEAPEPLTVEEAARRFRQTLQRGRAAERAVAAEDLVRAAADWRGELRRVVAGIPDAQRPMAELALVEARQRIVDRAFARLQQAFPGVFMFNAGTVSFASDIDITLRPVEQRPGFAGEVRPLPDQLAESSRAALHFGELLRSAVVGETDAVIDTNVYAYIGEQSFAPRTARERRASAALSGEVGMAEQQRGQGAEQWAQFRARMEAELAAARSPEAAAAQRQLLRQMERSEAYFAAREAERSAAEARVRQENPGASDAVVVRRARESLVAEKRARLAELATAQPPNFAEVARLQSEILWFEPEAYATGAAFEQAVAHGQSLRAAGSETTRTAIDEQRARLEELRGATPRDEAAIRRAEVDLAHLERQLETGRFPEEAVQTDIEAIQEREAERTAGRSPAQALAHSAGAASANYGMMVQHIEAAGDNLAAAIKAAGKYGGRILRAEQMAGVEPSSPEARVLLDLFMESRWTVFEGSLASATVDRMLVRYARQAGMHDQVTRTPGRPSTVSDAVRRQFVENMRRWAEGAVSELHRVAAETSERERAEAEVMGEPATPAAGSRRGRWGSSGGGGRR